MYSIAFLDHVFKRHPERKVCFTSRFVIKKILSSFFHVSPRFLNPEEVSLYYLDLLKKFLDPFYHGIHHHSIIARGICLMSFNQLRANLKFEIGFFNTRGLHHLYYLLVLSYLNLISYLLVCTIYQIFKSPFIVLSYLISYLNLVYKRRFGILACFVSTFQLRVSKSKC